MRYLLLCCAVLVMLPTAAAASARPAELQNVISTAAPFTSGEKVFEVAVSAMPRGGPITAPVTTTVIGGEEGSTTNEWISSIGGDGWQCPAPAGTVLRSTCTRTDRLGPGRSYPPIRIQVEVNEWVPQYAYLYARTDTAGARDPRCADASIRVDFNDGPTSGRAVGRTPHRTPADPGLGVSLAHGAEGMLNVTIANQPGAAATHGQIRALFTFEPGRSSAAYFGTAEGEGWSCGETYGLWGQELACTRDDVLSPGSSYPPIQVAASSWIDMNLYARVTTAADCGDQCSSGEIRLISS